MVAASHVVYVQAAPSIWDLLFPFIGAVCAIILAGVALWPAYRKRRDASDRRNARIDEACDVTLGVEADPNRGQYVDKPGLVHILPLNGRRLDGVPTVMDGVREAKDAAHAAKGAAEAARTGQKALAESVTDSLEQHMREDDERFSDVYRRIGAAG